MKKKEEDVFNSINSTKELRDFLKTKGNNHNYFYHYTTWDTFLKIYENKSFLATNHQSSNLNDQHELRNKKGDNLYHVSFSYGETEIMPMWILYGIPKTQAVRIGIPKKKMQKWITELQTDQKRFKMVTLTDIIYQNKKWYSRSNLHKNLPEEWKDSHDLVGCVKHYSWRYENEVRLLVSLPQKTDERIKLEFSDDIRDSFEIMTGPHFDISTCKNRELYDELCKENRISQSIFKSNEVNYRELCGNCIHEFSKRTEE